MRDGADDEAWVRDWETGRESSERVRDGESVQEEWGRGGKIGHDLWTWHDTTRN